MKITLLILMLTVTASLYGQKDTIDVKKWKNTQWTFYDSLPNNIKISEFVISTSSERNYAYLKNGSDTLILPDSVWNLYGNKIRYIKIKDKVYQLQ